MEDIENLKINSDIDDEKIIDFDSLHDQLIVDLSEELKPQPIAISIGHHDFRGKSYPTAFASYGDFSCLAGASKAKKTFVKSLLTSCYIGGNSNQYANNIRGHDTKGKYVIDIDTEQSKYHSQRAFRRVPEITGGIYDYYIPFSLRSKTPRERLAFVDWIFTKSKYRRNIGLVIIDGIADLITDINNIEESINIVQKLMEWSDNTNSHILTILHLNPGSDKPKGHLGTFIMQKAESIAMVSKIDDKSSSIKPGYARNMAFDEFSISIDNGLPYLLDNQNFAHHTIDDKPLF